MRYLLSYSLDLDPIEEAFSKLKGILRRMEARGRAALIEAMSSALWAISSHDVRGVFAHRGYHPLLTQQL